MFNSPGARSLTSVPPESEFHHWADYVELLCTTDLDGVFSADRLATIAQFEADLLSTSPDAQDASPADVLEALAGQLPSIETDSVEQDVAIADEFEANSDDEAPVDFGRASEGADDRYQWCQRIFSLLASRQRSLGENYPFEVSQNAMRIERRALNDERRSYLFYLCCSSLAYFSGSDRQKLTSKFELVSAELLKIVLPPTAVIDIYGTARGQATSQFVGTQFQRLEALAEVLRGKVLAEPDDFNPRDSGDNGLDLVAWIPMGDEARGVLAFFAQCACGRGWEAKQYEASHERWREFIHLKSPSSKLTFVPHYYRKVGESWYVDSEVSGLLIDRLRAMRIRSRLGSLIPAEIVDSVWDFRLPAV